MEIEYLIFRWISEKMDGIRAFWNGITLISRNGTEIKSPNWFIEQLPKDISLDCELWGGRGTFETLIGRLNSSDIVGWERIHLMVFDLPNSGEPYEMRMRNLSNQILPNHVQIVNVDRCKSSEDIGKYLAIIVDLGGEGMMANKANSMYNPMRVESLLKVKVSIISQILSLDLFAKHSYL